MRAAQVGEGRGRELYEAAEALAREDEQVSLLERHRVHRARLHTEDGALTHVGGSEAWYADSSSGSPSGSPSNSSDADAATDDDGSSSPQLLLDEELEPLTAANLKGRAVLIPREYWSDEPCTEYGGDGWRGKIDKVDLQKRAVGVRQDGIRHWFELNVVLTWRPVR